ncbi:MAG: hypothetical protein AABX61_00720 [Nanoarchaeota archaeon]
MDLPKNLEDRIVTTSVNNYINHYKLSPEDYELESIFFSSGERIRRDSHSLHDTLYKEMAEHMKKRGVIAVTDMRIVETAVAIDGVYLRRATMYGTAIVEKRK